GNFSPKSKKTRRMTFTSFFSNKEKTKYNKASSRLSPHLEAESESISSSSSSSDNPNIMKLSSEEARVPLACSPLSGFGRLTNSPSSTMKIIKAKKIHTM
ncbi:16644_t:CDS:2, partial [Entrophospora sp. SA101]